MIGNTVIHTNDEIIVHSNGNTYVHKQPASVGDMWRYKFSDDDKADVDIVIVYEVYDYYITVFNCNSNGNTYEWHKSNFYSSFEKVED